MESFCFCYDHDDLEKVISFIKENQTIPTNSLIHQVKEQSKGLVYKNNVDPILHCPKCNRIVWEEDEHEDYWSSCEDHPFVV